jgi:hypothetical protein
MLLPFDTTFPIEHLQRMDETAEEYNRNVTSISKSIITYLIN